MTAPADLTVCILGPDDPDALDLTLASAVGLGPVIVAVPEGGATGQADTVVSVLTLTLPLDIGVGAAWDALLRAAPTDRCLLLHAGEVLVAGHPGTDEPFGSCTVIDQPDPLAPPDRLGIVRVVDRRWGRVEGHLRPEVVTEGHAGGDRTGHAAHGSAVIVDAGSRPGPAHRAWLQFLAAELDDSADPADLLDVASVLAATEEYDAALVRLLQLVGAVHGDLGRRVARLASLCAIRRSRRIEVDLATLEWERLSPCPGPALAIRGASLAARLRSGPAAATLAAALEAGLADCDGVEVDRTWIESLLSGAKVRFAQLEPLVAAEIHTIRKAPSMWTICDSLAQIGRPLADIAASLSGEARTRFVAGCVKLARSIDVAECVGLANWLAAKGITHEVLTLLHAAAARGEMRLADAVDWSERLRALHKDEHCPLVPLAESVETPPVVRVLAAGALLERFADPRGIDAMRDAAAALHPAALEGVLARLAADAPGAVVAFIDAAGRTSRRRGVLADAFERNGMADLADDLRALSRA